MSGSSVGRPACLWASGAPGRTVTRVGADPRSRRGRAPARARVPSTGRPRPSGLERAQEPARTAPGLAVAGPDPQLGPGDGEVPAGARQADVEEPSLLRERVVVVDRLPDRQRPLLQAGEEHGVPLEPLGPVEREEVHAVVRALHLGRGPRRELREERRRLDLGPSSCHLDRRSPARSASAAVRSRASAPANAPSGSKPRSSRRRASRASTSAGPRVCAGTRRRRRSASRTSGRSKKRCPRTRNAIPAFVRAASRGGIWAFIRTRTAISAGGVPLSTSRRIDAMSRASSASPSAQRRIVGSRPGRLRGHEPLAAPLRGEEAVRERKDLRAAPVVAVQGHLAGRRVAGREARQERRRRAGERVDRLVLVARRRTDRRGRRATARGGAAGAGSCPGTRRR